MGDAGEIAKTAKPLIDNLAKLTGPMSEELGLYFGDKIRAFRQKNITTILQGSFTQLENAGKPVNPVPPRLLLPIMESASVEDNPTLQKMWSGLLASASDQTDNMSPSYAETLKSLTPIEARSLKVLYEALINSASQTLGFEEDISHTLMFGLGLVPGEAMAPVLIRETLERLGLIHRRYALQRSMAPYNPYVMHDYMQWPPKPEQFSLAGFVKNTTKPEEPLPDLLFDFSFTSYGVQFMRACNGPVAVTGDQPA